MDESGNYFGNELNTQLIERYRYFGKQVTFLVRIRRILNKNSSDLSPINSPFFYIKEIPEFNSIFKYFANRRQIHEIISKEVSKSDVLIARLPSTVGRYAIKYAIKYKKPYLVEVVGCPWDALFNYSFTGRMLAPYAYFLMRKFVKRAPFVLYVTQRFLQNRYPTNGKFIGVSDVILPALNTEDLEDRLNKIDKFEYSKPIILGTVAAIDVKYKGHESVIKAISLLNAKGFQFKYILIGKGKPDSIQSVAEMYGVKENITIAGQVPFEEVYDYLKNIDIYIQPSKQEGLPRALVEAMSVACPCIGASTGGIPELLDKNCIFEKGNFQALAHLLENFNIRELKNQANRNFLVAKNFGRTVLDEKREAFYSQFKSYYFKSD